MWTNTGMRGQRGWVRLGFDSLARPVGCPRTPAGAGGSALLRERRASVGGVVGWEYVCSPAAACGSTSAALPSVRPRSSPATPATAPGGTRIGSAHAATNPPLRAPSTCAIHAQARLRVSCTSCEHLRALASTCDKAPAHLAQRHARTRWSAPSGARGRPASGRCLPLLSVTPPAHGRGGCRMMHRGARGPYPDPTTTALPQATQRE